ncbi:hypothetical protein [Metabacillus fastidiosus]|nr:hypothetical protein [Metabacillus fastidiosus]MEC2078340.1 hypothetical protein [Metabacillus fastidiosus]
MKSNKQIKLNDEMKNHKNEKKQTDEILKEKGMTDYNRAWEDDRL